MLLFQGTHHGAHSGAPHGISDMKQSYNPSTQSSPSPGGQLGAGRGKPGGRPKSCEPGSPLLRRALSPDRLHPSSAEKQAQVRNFFFTSISVFFWRGGGFGPKFGGPKSCEPGSPLLRRALSPARLHPSSAEKQA